MDTPTPASHRGLLVAFGAFGLWGVFPLFIRLLAPAAPIEISAHRVVWTFGVCVVVLTVARRLRGTVRLMSDWRLLGRLALGATFLALNWLIFVIAVELGRVVDASLGYFLNPLVSVCLAVVVLHERLRPMQWAALGVAAIGIVIMVIGIGTAPWIALALAATFGLYGLTKKQVATRVTAVAGLGIETTVMLLPAAIYLAVLVAGGESTFGADVGVGGGLGHALLLASSGVVSAIPLVLFAMASRRLPLATIAMVQFVTPVLQFLVGVVVLDEHMVTARWVGFGFVWAALVLLTLDLIRTSRTRPLPPPVEPTSLPIVEPPTAEPAKD